MCASERGVGLVELLVALTIFSIGALGVAGTALLAAQRQRDAEAEQDAVLLAAGLLDSLAQLRRPVSDDRFDLDMQHASWSAEAVGAGLQLLRLRIEVPHDSLPLAFSVLLAPDPEPPPPP